MKKILFILRKPPHTGAYAQEALDLVMTAAAFDQDISLLLLDHAVFLIKQNQSVELAGLKDTASIFKALPLYDIENLYVETESLVEYGLTENHLSAPVICLARSQIGLFAKNFDLIMNL